jgi:hypothetical protein
MTMTRQQMFNTAYHGLAAQGFERSTPRNGGTGCAYRGADNRRCALGYLIPDSAYNPEWDKTGMSAWCLTEVNATPVICRKNQDFLEDLQEVHDSALTPDVMRTRLVEFAERWGLTIPALPDFTAAETPAPEGVTA